MREINRQELQTLRELRRELGPDMDRALKGRKVLVAQGGRREVFLASRRACRTLAAMGREPYFAGLYIGEVRKGNFVLGLEGAALIGREARRVYVSDEAEQLVLYGRDVFSKSVTKAVGEPRQGDRCLIVNSRSEVIGIGRFKGPREEVSIENVLDRGWYLRRGK